MRSPATKGNDCGVTVRRACRTSQRHKKVCVFFCSISCDTNMLRKASFKICLQTFGDNIPSRSKQSTVWISKKTLYRLNTSASTATAESF